MKTFASLNHHSSPTGCGSLESAGQWSLSHLVSPFVLLDIVEQQRASIVCLQESKVAQPSVTMNTELTSNDFDYAYLPAVGVAGGAITSWRRDLWSPASTSTRRFSVTTLLTPLNGPGAPWWLTNVYGPTARADKDAFLAPLW